MFIGCELRNFNLGGILIYISIDLTSRPFSRAAWIVQVVVTIGKQQANNSEEPIRESG